VNSQSSSSNIISTERVAKITVNHRFVRQAKSAQYRAKAADPRSQFGALREIFPGVTKYVGIDYSGAKTPRQPDGLAVDVLDAEGDCASSIAF
jgi:hypothetical protein